MANNVNSIASATSWISSLPVFRLSVRSRRALIGGFGLFVIALFIWRSHAGLSAVPRILKSADLVWVGAAVASELVALILIVGRSRVVLRRLGYRLSWWTLTRAYLRRKSVSAVVPGGGAPAAVVFARDLARVNVPADDAVYSIALNGFTGTVGTAFVILPVLFLPFGVIRGGTIGLLPGLLLLALFGLAMTTGLVLCQARWIPICLAKRAPTRAMTFVASVRGHNIRMRDLIIPVQMAIFSNAAGVCALYASLRAVHQDLSFDTLMATRAVGALSSRLSPVFQGSGLVESSMASVLQHAGQAAGTALAATVLYRLIQVWIPVTIGLMFFATFPAVRLQSNVRTLARAAYGMSALSVLAALTLLLSDTAELESDWLLFAGSSLLPTIAAVAVMFAWLRNRRRRLDASAIMVAKK
jgi:uncharacterized membrane protein YbhN (UPF0104 family)